MHNEKFAFEPSRKIYRRRIAIAVGIFLRRSHVALGVNGIVSPPVRYWRAGKSSFENTSSAQHGHTGHVSAKAPSPNPNARAINVGLIRKPLHSGQLIRQLYFAKPMIDRRLEVMSARGCAAII